ncbi:MAG: Rieske 2Fe-2S domain-containing protein [Candidatus Binatia bacterium]
MQQNTEARYDRLVRDDRVHVTLYTDARIFEEELEKIFYRGWVFVGHESEVPKSGDFVTRLIGRQPVIMVRDKDGSIAVLLNRCAHRGSTVCTAEQGNAKVFACPYHGWIYDLGGHLLSTSHPGGFDQSFDKSQFGLSRAARIDSYRGFVFACLTPTEVSLAAHLGLATQLIDRACDLSPEGEIELTAGWIRHCYSANWKMLPENDTDGYHLTFTHASFIKSINSQYSLFAGDENDVRAVLRDWGKGHTEIDWAPGYKRPFDWFGGGPEGKFARYLSVMEQQYGRATAQQRAFDGPPHAIIFPNLFLAEMNIVIMQPVSVNACIHWHTPMFLKGVPEFNTRLLRQSEAAMGPASFLTSDDATIASRNQVGLEARNPEWLEIRRGLQREEIDSKGRKVAHLTDETTNRAFWHHYRTVMSA